MASTSITDKYIPSFIADCHLGKLARYLRLMGFDMLYFTQIEDDDLITTMIFSDMTPRPYLYDKMEIGKRSYTL